MATPPAAAAGGGPPAVESQSPVYHYSDEDDDDASSVHQPTMPLVWNEHARARTPPTMPVTIEAASASSASVHPMDWEMGQPVSTAAAASTTASFAGGVSGLAEPAIPRSPSQPQHSPRRHSQLEHESGEEEAMEDLLEELLPASPCSNTARRKRKSSVDLPGSASSSSSPVACAAADQPAVERVPSPPASPSPAHQAKKLKLEDITHAANAPPMASRPVAVRMATTTRVIESPGGKRKSLPAAANDNDVPSEAAEKRTRCDPLPAAPTQAPETPSMLPIFEIPPSPCATECSFDADDDVEEELPPSPPIPQPIAALVQTSTGDAREQQQLPPPTNPATLSREEKYDEDDDEPDELAPLSETPEEDTPSTPTPVPNPPAAASTAPLSPAARSTTPTAAAFSSHIPNAALWDNEDDEPMPLSPEEEQEEELQAIPAEGPTVPPPSVAPVAVASVQPVAPRVVEEILDEEEEDELAPLSPDEEERHRLDVTSFLSGLASISPAAPSSEAAGGEGDGEGTAVPAHLRLPSKYFSGLQRKVRTRQATITTINPLPPLPVAAAAAAAAAAPSSKSSPAPPALLPITIPSQSYWSTLSSAIASFRFPFSLGIGSGIGGRVSAAVDCYPLTEMKSFDLAGAGVRVCPMVRLPREKTIQPTQPIAPANPWTRTRPATAPTGPSFRYLDPTKPIQLLSRRFDHPLEEACQWLAHGFACVSEMMVSVEVRQRDLLRQYLDAQLALQVRSHHLTAVPSPRAEVLAGSIASVASTSEAFHRSFTSLLDGLAGIDAFFAYLNAFILETFKAETEWTAVWPTFTDRARGQFLYCLAQCTMDLHRIGTVQQLGPVQELLDAARRADSATSASSDEIRTCVTHIGTVFLTWQLKVQQEVLWLYDQQMLKYNLITLRSAFAGDDHDSRRSAPSSHAHPLAASSSSPTLDSCTYFPILTVLDQMMSKMLEISLAHPKLITPPIQSQATRPPGVGVRDGRASKDGLEWVWHPLASTWLKLKETCLALDRAVLYARCDDLPNAIKLLWEHAVVEGRPIDTSSSSSLDAHAIDAHAHSSSRFHPLAVEVKQKRVEDYRRDLRDKDLRLDATRFGLLDVLWKMKAEEWLAEASSGKQKTSTTTAQTMMHQKAEVWSDKEFMMAPGATSTLGSRGVQWTGAQSECLLRRAMDAFEKMALVESDSRGGSNDRSVLLPPASASSSAAEGFSLLDKVETILSVQLQILLPHLYHFECFLTEQDGAPPAGGAGGGRGGRVHRELEVSGGFDGSSTQTPSSRMVGAGSAAAGAPATTGPFLLLPFMKDRVSPPAGYALSIEAFLRAISCSVDWSLFSFLLDRVTEITDWHPRAMRGGRAEKRITWEAATEEEVAAEPAAAVGPRRSAWRRFDRDAEVLILDAAPTDLVGSQSSAMDDVPLSQGAMADYLAAPSSRDGSEMQDQEMEGQSNEGTVPPAAAAAPMIADVPMVAPPSASRSAGTLSLRILYPILFLRRLHSLQRRTMLTFANLKAESQFITDSVWRCDFLSDTEVAVRAQQAAMGEQKSPRSSSARAYLMPRMFDVSVLHAGVMGLEVASASALTELTQRQDAEARQHDAAVRAQVDDFFTLALKMVHSFLARSFRPQYGHARLFGRAPASAHARELIEWLHSRAADTRDRAMSLFVWKMLCKAKSPLRDAPVAMKKLELRQSAHLLRGGQPRYAKQFYFWHDDVSVDATLARTNLLRMQRRLSLLLVTCLLLPRDQVFPAIFHEKEATPLAVLAALTANVLASRWKDEGLIGLPCRPASELDASDTHSIAEHNLFVAYQAMMRMRQDWVDVDGQEWKEFAYWKAQKPGGGTTTPWALPPTSTSTDVASRSHQTYSWPGHYLHCCTDPLASTSYQDVLTQFLTTFYIPIWRSLMDGESKRRSIETRTIPPSTTTSSASSSKGAQAFEREKRFYKGLDRQRTYLVDLLDIVQGLITRKHNRWTVNDLAVLKFDTNPPGPPATPAAPSGAGRPAASGVASTPSVRGPHRPTLLLHELLRVHGSFVRVPFALRWKALALVRNLLPGGLWTPGETRTMEKSAARGAAASAPPVYMPDDEDDDAAFREFDLEMAGGAAAASATSAAALARAAWHAEHTAALAVAAASRTVELRQAYVRALCPHLAQFVPLLQQLLWSNLHDSKKVQQRANERMKLEALAKTMAISSLVVPPTPTAAVVAQRLNAAAAASAGVAPPRTFAEATLAVTEQQAALAASTAAASAAAAKKLTTSYILPLSHHLIPSPHQLHDIVSLLATVAHLLAAENVIGWKIVGENWFPVWVADDEKKTTQTTMTAQGRTTGAQQANRALAMTAPAGAGHRPSASAPSTAPAAYERPQFTFAEIDSPLREELVLHFYTALLEPTLFYRASNRHEHRAFADSPQLFLQLWLHRMVDYEAALLPALLTFTRAILATSSWPWPGSTSYGALCDFFDPTKEKVHGWVEKMERMMRSHGVATVAAARSAGGGVGRGGHSLGVQATWKVYNEKLRVLFGVLWVYGRKFSPTSRLTPDGSISHATSVNSGTIASSSGVTSIFTRLPALLYRNVCSMNEAYAAGVGGITESLLGLYLAFVNELTGVLLEQTADCFHPHSLPLSMSLLASFTAECLRAEPFGVANHDAYATSITLVPSALLGYAAYLPNVSGVEAEAEGAKYYASSFALRGQLHHLWLHYLQVIFARPDFFRATPHSAPQTLARSIFLFTRPGEDTTHAQFKVEPRDLVHWLWRSWREGLAEGMAELEFLPQRERVKRPKRVKMIRAGQIRLVRRYLLATYVTHAVGQAVLVHDGDARIQWAQAMLVEIVLPLLAKLDPHQFPVEFRLVLPGLLGVLFQTRSFLPPFHPSPHSPATLSQALKDLPMHGHFVRDPWTIGVGVVKLRKTILRAIDMAVRKCTEEQIAPQAAANAPTTSVEAAQARMWSAIFGDAPFITTDEIEKSNATTEEKNGGTHFLHLLICHLVYEVKCLLHPSYVASSASASASSSQLVVDRWWMEARAKDLARVFFRPKHDQLAVMMLGLAQNLPRPPIVGQHDAPMPAWHLLYLDTILQHMRIWQRIMRVQLVAPKEKGAGGAAAAAAAAAAVAADEVPSPPAPILNQWTRRPVQSVPIVAAAPAPSAAPAAASKFSLWSDAGDDEPPEVAGVHNRGWLEFLLSKLRPLLEPSQLSPTVRLSDSYRRVCAEYHQLLETVADPQLVYRYKLPQRIDQGQGF